MFLWIRVSRGGPYPFLPLPLPEVLVSETQVSTPKGMSSSVDDYGQWTRVLAEVSRPHSPCYDTLGPVIGRQSRVRGVTVYFVPRSTLEAWFPTPLFGVPKADSTV